MMHLYCGTQREIKNNLIDRCLQSLDCKEKKRTKLPTTIYAVIPHINNILHVFSMGTCTII